jgi:hypothetical protein
LRARVFLRDGVDYRYGCELGAADADDVWRQLEQNPAIAGRSLNAGDVVYIGDTYLELDGDGGWNPIPPGTRTLRLYELALSAEGGLT